MKLRALSFVVVACVGLSAHRSVTAQGIPCSYEVAHVIQAPDGPFGASPTGATAISPNGRYVCGSFNPGGIGSDRAFVFDTQTHEFHALALPVNGFQSWCNDVNDAGLAVGAYTITDPPLQLGFVYDMALGQYVAELPPLPGGAWCAVTGINSSNTLCGWRSIGSKGDPVNPQTAFIWSEMDGFTDLGLIDGRSTTAESISDDGQVAVSTGIATAGAFAHLWDGTTLINLGPIPGGNHTHPNANASGSQVVGSGWISVSGHNQVRPFRFHNGQVEPLATLDQYPIGAATGVNDAGLVVGACAPMSGPLNWQPCAWLGGVLRDLNPLIVPTNGIAMAYASAVSADGEIVCAAETANGEVISVLLSPATGIAGDTNCDRIVNIDDLLTVIGFWGPGASFGDLNGDLIVNVLDLLVVIDNWGTANGG